MRANFKWLRVFARANASRFFNLYRDLRGAIQFRIVSFLSKSLHPRVTLTYFNSEKPDGVGAQVQRILAIASLSKNLNLGYIHTGVASVAVHPLDPYQSEMELKKFLEELNHLFHINPTVSVSTDFEFEISVKNLLFTDLIKTMFKSFFLDQNVLIRIVEPYGISEHDPLKFKDISALLPNFSPLSKSKQHMVIHYRRGVGGLSVQKGEKISREVESKFFTRLASEVYSHGLNKIENFTIFTDSPSLDLEYIPPMNQEDLWVNSSKFENGVMNVSGLDMAKVFYNFPIKPVINYGGDPLVAIRTMAGADFLIMSRSSFSYVGALLNSHGIIFFPSRFWHKPMNNWKVVNENHYVK